MKNSSLTLPRKDPTRSASRTKGMLRRCPRGGNPARWRRWTRAPSRKSGASLDSALREAGCCKVRKGGRVEGVGIKSLFWCLVFECSRPLSWLDQSPHWSCLSGDGAPVYFRTNRAPFSHLSGCSLRDCQRTLRLSGLASVQCASPK